MALAWKPGYEADEIAVGVAVAIALHALPIAAIVLHVMLPAAPPAEAEQPFVARPVVAATLLKLGKPLDPTKLPDRLVPQARTAPKKELVASRDEPLKHTDAGAPKPNTQDSDISNLIAKTDPFAEDAGKARPDEGHALGVEGGTETDPSKVKAGDMYAARLSAFFHERWQYPTVISQGEANRLCVGFQLAIGRNMAIFHLQRDAVRKSGNDLFDDSARAMFQKLLDDGTRLPDPPPEVVEQYRGRTVSVLLSGDLHGDSSRCK